MKLQMHQDLGRQLSYYYFKSKEDVLTAILLDGWLKIWESLEPVIAEQNSEKHLLMF